MAGGEGNDSSAPAATTTVAHVNVISDGSNPLPIALVAVEMHKVPQNDQVTASGKFYNFLTNPTSNLLELNTDDVLCTAIISIPNSSNVKGM
jgi:hypothetical protein